MGQYRRHVFVCTEGETCRAQGAVEDYVAILRRACAEAGLGREVRINRAGCFSQCGHGPMIVVYPEDVWYGGVTAADLPELVAAHLVEGRPVERLRYAPGVPGPNKKTEAR